MKWLIVIAIFLLIVVGVNLVRDFLNKYYLFILEKEEIEEEMDQESALDLRGTPTHVCVCGSEHFYVRAIFQDYEISTYFLDMTCASCGSLATAPTPLDREEMDQ
jgi:hypothetical protein